MDNEYVLFFGGFTVGFAIASLTICSIMKFIKPVDKTDKEIEKLEKEAKDIIKGL